MKKKKWILLILSVALLPLVSALPAAAQDADVSDIALQPGAEPSQLNITWHSGEAVAGDTCSVQVTKNPFRMKRFHWFFCHFPGFARIFDGTWVDAGVDEYGNSDAYCKVTVDGLKSWERYTYRVSDGSGDWSESYKYNPSSQKKYGFLFVADPQIGASGGGELSRSREGEPYITEYYETNDLPSDETIEAYLETKNPYDDEETELYSDYAGWEAYIDGLLEAALLDVVGYIYNPVFYEEYSDEGMDTDFSDVALLDAGLAEGLLTLIEEKIVENMAAIEDDAAGWNTTVELMTAMFPRAAFMISGGDQVEEKTDEYEYTGFFTPSQLTSLPLAPTYASHDRGYNFEYHFNLPNESEEYGQDRYGVGDYYFTHGDTLIMVLNMDVTNGLFPRGDPPGPPPGGGGPPGGSDDSDETDTDGDGVIDDDDLCPETYGGSLYGCPLTADYDDDADGVSNDMDDCNNTLAEHLDAGLIDLYDGCPFDGNDSDNDGIPDVDADAVTIDRCLNTYDDFTVDEDGCAECDYLETDDELQAWLAELEATCEDVEDEVTGEVTTVCELDDFKASLEEHQAFMAEAIEANPKAKWKIVVWHYSIYSAAMHSTDDQSEGIRYMFTPMLDDLDIDVVLMGHDHAYTRTYQMLGNEPQLDQMVDRKGRVINPTGIVYLTASSSSGSKYYELNCNIADDTMTSNAYYEYAANFDEYIPTFTHFEVDDNTLKLSSYTYLEVEDEEGVGTGEYDVTLIDEYAIEKKPPFWKKGRHGKGMGM